MLLRLVLLALTLQATGSVMAQAGPVSVAIEIEEMDHCSLEPGGVCVVSWDPGEDEGLGDDHIDTSKRIERAFVGVDAPEAVPPVGVELRPRDVAIEHGAGRHVRPVLQRLSEGIPGALEPFAHAELRTHWFLLFVHLPEPLRNPINDRSDVHVPIPLDCAALFTDYAHWDEACTADELHPLPNGANFTDDSDRMLAVTVGFMACEYAVAYVTPDACPLADAAHAAGTGFLALWYAALPNFSQGGAIEALAGSVSPATTETLWDFGRAGRTEGMGATGHAPGLAAGDTQSLPARFDADARYAEPSTGSWLGAARFSSASPSPRVELLPRAVGLMAGVLAAAALGIAVLLYHRITRARALDQATRHRIHALLLADPGLRAGTIARRCGIAHNSAKHHLKLLVALGLVTATGVGQLRYFGGRVAPQAQRQAEALAMPAARRIHEFLLVHGPTDMRTLCVRLGLAKSTVSGASVRLAEVGLLERRRRGGSLEIDALPSALPPHRGTGPMEVGEARDAARALVALPS